MKDGVRQHQHAERMLARARRKAKQAAILVAKWEKVVNESNRKQVSENQASLWNDGAAESAVEGMELCQ